MLRTSFFLLSSVFIVGIGTALENAPSTPYLGIWHDKGPAYPGMVNPCDLVLPVRVPNIYFYRWCHHHRMLDDFTSEVQLSEESEGKFVQDPSTAKNTVLKEYFVNSTVKTNWFHAQGLCKSLNMSLATVETDDDVKALSLVLSNAGVKTAWISGANLKLPSNDTNPSKVPIDCFFWNTGDPLPIDENLCYDQESVVCQYFSTE